MFNKSVSQLFHDNKIHVSSGFYYTPDMKTISKNQTEDSIMAVSAEIAVSWIEKNKNFFIETEMYVIKDEKSRFYNHRAYRLKIKTTKNKVLITIFEKEMFSNRNDAVVYGINKVFEPNFGKTFKDTFNQNFNFDVMNEKLNNVMKKMDGFFKKF